MLRRAGDAEGRGHLLQLLQRLLAGIHPGLVGLPLGDRRGVEEGVAGDLQGELQADRTAEGLGVEVGLGSAVHVQRAGTGILPVGADRAGGQVVAGADQLERRAGRVGAGDRPADQRIVGARVGQLGIVGNRDSPDELGRIEGRVACRRDHPAGVRIQHHHRAAGCRLALGVLGGQLVGQRLLGQRLHPGVDAGDQGVARLGRHRGGVADRLTARVQFHPLLAVHPAQHRVIGLLQPAAADGVGVGQLGVRLLVRGAHRPGVAEHVRGQRAVRVVQHALVVHGHPGEVLGVLGDRQHHRGIDVGGHRHRLVRLAGPARGRHVHPARGDLALQVGGRGVQDRRQLGQHARAVVVLLGQFGTVHGQHVGVAVADQHPAGASRGSPRAAPAARCCPGG